VVARFGSNPLKVIQGVKEKIRQISPGLDRKALIHFDRTTAQEVRAYAEARGFGAYDGPAMNQGA